MSTIVKIIEYVNLLLLLTMFGSTCYVHYRLNSEILDQLTNLEKNVDPELTKPKRGRKKKTDTKINEVEENDVRDKRERLVACVLSGNSKMYLGKEFTEKQINEMDCTNVNTLLNRYESILRLLTHVGFLRQNGLILSEVFLFMEGSKNQEKKYIITVQKNLTFLRRFDRKNTVLGILRNLINKFVFR